MQSYLEKALNDMSKTPPLVYCLTNTVTIADCANVLAAMGASPLMSFGSEDIREILPKSTAVLLNIGCMEDAHMDLIPPILEQSQAIGVPIVLDPVGAGFTTARANLVQKILQYPIACIRGNRSEIESLLPYNIPKGRGVDALQTDSAIPKSDICHLAKTLGTIIAMTGPQDFITDGERCVTLQHGHPSMSRIVGTGCMSSAMATAMMGVSDPFWGVVVALGVMALSGENAFENPDIFVGSAKVRLMDTIQQLYEKRSLPLMRVLYEKA